MKILIAEDDLTSRKVLQEFLSSLGESDVAVNGPEALQSFKDAHEAGKPYQLICLDIMMPGVDGRTVLKQIRRVEEESGIGGLDRVKVVMTTGLDDPENEFGAFGEGCEAYITKPIGKEKLFDELRRLQLID